MPTETKAMTSAEAAKRAEKLGTTPVGAPEFARDVLHLPVVTVHEWRHREKMGTYPDNIPKLPARDWMVSGRRPAWTISTATAFKDAYMRGDVKFKARKISVPRELTPIGLAEIAKITGAKLTTIMKWVERANAERAKGGTPRRSLFPEATWTVGGKPAWALGVIEDWNEDRNNEQWDRATTPRARSRAARNLTQALLESKAIKIDKSGKVTVNADVADIEIDPLDGLALRLSQRS